MLTPLPLSPSLSHPSPHTHSPAVGRVTYGSFTATPSLSLTHTHTHTHTTHTHTHTDPTVRPGHLLLLYSHAHQQSAHDVRSAVTHTYRRGRRGGGGVYTPFHTYTMLQAIEEGYIMNVLQVHTHTHTHTQGEEGRGEREERLRERMRKTRWWEERFARDESALSLSLSLTYTHIHTHRITPR